MKTIKSLVLLLPFGLSGCVDLNRLEEHDPILQYTQGQYEQLLTGTDEVPVPLRQEYVPPKSEPQIPKELMKEVSLSINDQVPLKEVFMELARQAKINIVVSPMVKGGVNYQAYTQPAIGVIKDVCSVNKLRYSIDRKTVRIEPDKPHLKTDNVQTLDLIRQTKTRISMATDVFTAMEGYIRDFDNGSSTLLTDESRVDFWEELRNNLSHILKSGNSEDQGNFTIHKQAGIVTVFGTQIQHDQIKQYLQDILYSTQLQVLIEAKIVEVTLKDEYQTGINWSHLKGDFRLEAPLGDITRPRNFHDHLHHHLDHHITPVKNVFTIGSAGTLTALASVLDQFGTVRTLASPRVTVLNNQAAVLKVAT